MCEASHRISGTTGDFVPRPTSLAPPRRLRRCDHVHVGGRAARRLDGRRRPAEGDQPADVRTRLEAAEVADHVVGTFRARYPSSWPGLARWLRATGSGCRLLRHRDSPQCARASRPGAEPITKITGVRMYLVRALATFSGGSPLACIASATTSPSRARASPSAMANRHGHVRLWFGAHWASSHRSRIISCGTSRCLSTSTLVRRRRIRSVR